MYSLAMKHGSRKNCSVPDFSFFVKQTFSVNFQAICLTSESLELLEICSDPLECVGDAVCLVAPVGVTITPHVLI